MGQLAVFMSLCAAGLVVAAHVVRRRRGGSSLFARASNRAIRVVDRAVISQTLSVCLLEIDGVRYVLAEGKGGVVLTREMDGRALTS